MYGKKTPKFYCADLFKSKVSFFVPYTKYT